MDKILMKEELNRIKELMGLLTEEEQENQIVKIFSDGGGSDFADKYVGKKEKILVSDTLPNEPFKDMSYMETSDNIKNMIKSINDGEELPPIKVIQHPYDKSKYVVVDENHRRYAYTKSDVDEIDVIIIPHKDVVLMKSKWGEDDDVIGPLSKLKNILAENLLRFGAKGVSKETLKKYIIEQVTSNPIYAIIYSKLGDKSKRYWDGTSTEKNIPKITDPQKENILKQIEQKINTSVQLKTNQGRNTNFNKELKNIKSVNLRYKAVPPVATTTQSEIIEIPYLAQYPDASNNNPELQNFYLTDNEIEVLPDRRQKFEQMVQELKSLIPASETIKEIHIKAGSSTSQVPTTYKGETYKTIQEGQQNNIALANDRCMKIEQVLNEIIKIQFPGNDDKIIIDERQAKPNNGPLYTTRERSYFFGTGKLDPAKKSEYDEMYGPFKGSYGSVMIITTGVSTSTEETEDIIKTGEWYVRLDTNEPAASKPKKKYRSKSGGGISVGGGAIIPSCAIW